ncbi:MAG: alkaline phosphatase [Oleispira sp.]|jgi:alkaline phosphatase
MRSLIKLSSAILTASLLSACGADSDSKSTVDAAPGIEFTGEQIKNVILMIGDGMGPQQVGLLQDFAAHSKTDIYNNRETALALFANSGQLALSSTTPVGGLVVDSACSATQLATGQPSLSEVVGLDVEGNSTETILEMAKAAGKSTGLISDTRITHATPAAFAAHQAHRSMENEIAVDMLENNVDVLLGGGLRYWIPEGSSSDNTDLVTLINEPTVKIKSKRKDNRNLLTEAQTAGYSLAFNADQLDAVAGQKVLGLFSYSAMLDGISYSTCKKSGTCVQPSLAEMTKKALDILSKDEDGFFLMVEGGQIDWAAHNNDAGDMLHQLLKFDESIQAVYDWVKDRDDTLVVITADHETGGFSFSYSRKDIPEADSTIVGDAFVESNRDYKPNFNFANPDLLDKLYAQKKDFYNIWYEAGGDLGDVEPTSADLLVAMNNNTEFPLTQADADRILEHESNEYQVDDHKYLAVATFPKVDDFEEFYVYGEEVHLDLMGRALAKHQNTVWSTGTHTHTPVQVIAWGPKESQQRFKGLMNHVDVGAQLIEAMKN